MPTRNKTGIKGCFHIHIEDGKIKNVFSHLGDLPQNGVIHLLPDKSYTLDKFVETHPYDLDEINVPYVGKIHELGPLSVDLKDGVVKTKMKIEELN